jgi:hypothetical protein
MVSPVWVNFLNKALKGNMDVSETKFEEFGACDRLCSLVVRVLGYRSGGPGSIPCTTRFSRKKKRKQVVGLEQGPLSLSSTTEELLDRKVAAPV